ARSAQDFSSAPEREAKRRTRNAPPADPPQRSLREGGCAQGGFERVAGLGGAPARRPAPLLHRRQRSRIGSTAVPCPRAEIRPGSLASPPAGSGPAPLPRRPHPCVVPGTALGYTRTLLVRGAIWIVRRASRISISRRAYLSSSTSLERTRAGAVSARRRNSVPIPARSSVGGVVACGARGAAGGAGRRACTFLQCTLRHPAAPVPRTGGTLSNSIQTTLGLSWCQSNFLRAVILFGGFCGGVCWLRILHEFFVFLLFS
ncbi:hypothetical protein B0H15DRAFT_1026918, partial [Mycena belliarum]